MSRTSTENQRALAPARWKEQLGGKAAKRRGGRRDIQANFRLTRKVDGKTVTESFSTPAAFRKAQREVTEFHRFQTLSADLLAVNEKICRLRPVEPERGGWTPQEKKRLLRSIRRSPEK